MPGSGETRPNPVSWAMPTQPGLHLGPRRPACVFKRCLFREISPVWVSEGGLHQKAYPVHRS